MKKVLQLSKVIVSLHQQTRKDMKTLFLNNTTNNAKFQIFTTENISGNGIKNYGGSNILEVNGKIFKNLTNFWVSASALKNLKNNYNVISTSF